MDAYTATCVEVLHRAGVALSPGLTSVELRETERRFGFRLAPEHRGLLAAVLPLGPRWVDWRNAPEHELADRLAAPADGLLFDVRHNEFWPTAWGRPPGEDVVGVATERLAEVPRLIPVYGHRYLPAAPAPSPAPVFSVHQSDVIHYGSDLLDYLAREFDGRRTSMRESSHVPFWSDLADAD